MLHACNILWCVCRPIYISGVNTCRLTWVTNNIKHELYEDIYDLKFSDYCICTILLLYFSTLKAIYTVASFTVHTGGGVKDMF